MGGPNSQMGTTSLQGKARRDVKVDKLEHGLARARASIKEAALNNKVRELDQDYVPEGPSYLNAYAFHRLVSHFVDFILVQSLYIYIINNFLLQELFGNGEIVQSLCVRRR